MINPYYFKLNISILLYYLWYHWFWCLKSAIAISLFGAVSRERDALVRFFTSKQKPKFEESQTQNKPVASMCQCTRSFQVESVYLSYLLVRESWAQSLDELLLGFTPHHLITLISHIHFTTGSTSQPTPHEPIHGLLGWKKTTPNIAMFLTLFGRLLGISRILL